jgi:flagellar biosynthetic protein FliQ
MTPEFAAEILKNLMYQAVLLAAPVLLTGMVIGLGVSLFQTITSISEQTLTFVPKALAVVALLVLLLPWLLRSVISFSISIIEKIPAMVR